MSSVLNSTAKKIRICARSKRWWNADIKERRKAVGREKRRRQNSEETARPKAELQKSIRRSKSQMRSDYLQNLQGAEVWRAAQYTNPRAGRTVEALTDREGRQANTAAEKEEMLRRESFPPNDNDQYYERPPAGSAHTRVTEQAVERSLLSQSVKKAPGPDKLSFGAKRVLWKWDIERIVRLMKAGIRTGRHPAVWKCASSVVIRKLGKEDYTTLKAYRSISLLSCMGKVVEKVVAELLSEEAERRGLLSDGQLGSRKGRSAIDAAAIMVDRAHAAWTNGHITGVLLMDIKAAFPSVAKGRLVNLMKVRQMDGDLIRWMESFLSERTLEMIIEGNAMERHPVGAGVLQGSPVSPILFAIYTSGLIKWVEENVSEAEGLYLVDDLGWVATGNDVNQVVTILQRCAAVSMEWAIGRGLQFDTARTEAALFTRRRGHKRHLRPELTAKIKVGEVFIWFNRQATRWLGIWMVAHLTLNEHHNRCMKRARAAEASLRTLTKTYGVVPESVRAVKVACVQGVALYGSELWWDPSEAGRRDDLQVLLNRQARSILGALPTTPQGALMRDSGLTPAPVILESRQQRFAARLANACGNMWRKLHQDPSSGTPVCRAVNKEHEHGRTTEGMNWPAPGEESVVRTIILDDATAANRATQRWASVKEAKVGAGVWMWWTDGLRSDAGQVGAAAVCKHRDEWRSRRSYLGTGRMEAFDAELWAIRHALDVAIEKRETLQKHGVEKVAVFSDSQAPFRRTAHLEPGPGQRLASQINRRPRSVRAHRIATEINWVPGHSGIPGNDEADRQGNLAPDATGSTMLERAYTSASNSARRISVGRSAAKAQWEADKCSKHFSYRLKGKAGTKRPIPMTRVKLLAARFYRLKSRHAPTGVYLKRFGHRDDDTCWWCAGTVTQTQTREHLFRHCSRWRNQQKALWKAVGKATGWKAGRCRHVQVSELFSVEECDQAVMDFLAATEVGNFPPN